MSLTLGPGIRFVLLDHDDTQVETIAAKWAAHKQVATAYYGKLLGDDEIRRHWGKPLRELVCLLYGESDSDRALARYMPTSPDFPKTLYEGTLSVLQSIRQSGRPVGVVTATSRESLEFDWVTLGIEGGTFFDFIQTEDDVEYHKPDPRVFDSAIRWAAARGISRAEMIYVGDSLLDMEAAVQSGLQFMGVATGLVSVAEFQAAGVTAIPALSDLTVT